MKINFDFNGYNFDFKTTDGAVWRVMDNGDTNLFASEGKRIELLKNGDAFTFFRASDEVNINLHGFDIDGVHYELAEMFPNENFDQGKADTAFIAYLQSLPQTSFNRLPIRYACRKLGLEEKLDNAINLNDQSRKEWYEALEISFDNLTFLYILSLSGFGHDEVIDVINNIEEEKK